MSKTQKETTLRLFGVIGDEVNGDQFAKELARLEGKVDTVNLHINSLGGNVVQGYSILSVMLSMQTPVNVYVVGIAASMAAVIAVCGEKVHMYDYSRLMIHDPFFAGTDTSKLDEKDKTALANTTNSLRTILSRRGKSENEIARLMEAETWFSADQAKKEGLIDEIISTKRKNEFSNMDSQVIFRRIRAEYFSKNSNNNLKTSRMDLLEQLASILGLDNPTEESVIQAVRNLVNDQSEDSVKEKLDNALQKGIIDTGSYPNLLDMGYSAPESFNNYLKKLTDEYEAKLKHRVEDFLKENKAKYLFLSPAGKDKIKELGEKDFDLLVDLTRTLPPRKWLSEEIKDAALRNAALKNTSDHSLRTLSDYRKYAPDELRNNPQLYERLLEKENRRK